MARSRRVARFASCLVISCCVGHAQTGWAWLYSTTVPLDSDVRGNTVATDGEGNVVLGGTEFVIKLDGEDGVVRWRHDISPYGNGVESLAVDASGDVFAVTDAGDVMRLDGDDGSVVWSVNFNFGNQNQADQFQDLALDSVGNAVIAGAFNDVSGFSEALAIKLDGDDGSVLWTYTKPVVGGESYFYAIARDSAGDWIAVGRISGTTRDPFAVKLAGSTGTESWLYHGAGDVIDGKDDLRAVAIDAAGNAYAAGRLGDGDKFLAIKLDGVSGTETWRFTTTGTLATDNGAAAVTIASDGDPVVVGTLGEPGPLFGITDRAFAVIKLDASTGSEAWRTGIGVEGQATAVAASGTGQLAVGGWTNVGTTSSRNILTVSLLEEADGSEVLRQVFTRDVSKPNFFGTDAAVVYDAAGHVAAAGTVHRTGNKADLAAGAARFSERLLGNALSLRDAGAASKLKVKSRDRLAVLPALGTSADPTAGGATVTLLNPTTTESAVYPLPASGWAPRGSDAGTLRGYTYKDRSSANGPCTSVKLTTSGLKIVCKGALGFTLDEPSQGSLAVFLALGQARQCMEFGGDVRRDDPVSSGRGQFTARNAPRPAACSPLP